MKALKQFVIPFTGLKTGKHEFNYDVDADFFKAFEYSLVKDGKLAVKLELDKQETMMILLFNIEGTIKLECDKCLADFDYPVNINERQIVKFGGDEGEEEAAEIMVLSRSDSDLDVSTLIYEYIMLAVPFVKNCTQDGLPGVECDAEMLQKLEQLSVRDNDSSGADPRWAALNNLK